MLLFAIVILINFILNNILSRKSEIGILRALGAGKSTVIGIFLVEITAIMLITFVFGLLLSQAACMAFNIVLSSVVNRTFNLIQVGLKEIGCIVALGLVVAAFAMLLPLSRINRMKPIDAIRK
jgi:ABC-type transport system, involved in lipoprotein release, permease component